MLHRMFTLVLLAVCTYYMTPTLYAARRAKLSPAKVKQIREANLSYSECRTTALKTFQVKRLPKKILQQMLDQCVEFFPAASFYTECKRRLLTDNKEDARTILNKCRRYLVATTFDPKRPNPIMVHKVTDSPPLTPTTSPRSSPEDNSLFFAGLGLNHKLPIASFAPPNFECSDLTEAFGAVEKRQYLLFGNHPKVFFEQQAVREAMLRLQNVVQSAGAGDQQQSQAAPDPAKRTPAQQKLEGVVTPFGQLFGDPTQGEATLFFPAAACHFSGPLGPVFSGLSAYYLIDDRDDTATPYFGIAYYKDMQVAPNMSTLSEEVRRALGPRYRVVRKNRETIFLLSSDFKELDEEQDPKNLCAHPRKHQYAAVLQSQPHNLQRTNYLIVANVRNICEYGDRLARRLAD